MWPKLPIENCTLSDIPSQKTKSISREAVHNMVRTGSNLGKGSQVPKAFTSKMPTPRPPLSLPPWILVYFPTTASSAEKARVSLERDWQAIVWHIRICCHSQLPKSTHLAEFSQWISSDPWSGEAKTERWPQVGISIQLSNCSEKLLELHIQAIHFL